MAVGVLLKSGGMDTVSTLFVTFYVFLLVQILWDDSFPCTVESGKVSYLLNTYGRALLLLKYRTFLFTGTAFFVWRSCGWNRAGGKFLSGKSGCRPFRNNI